MGVVYHRGASPRRAGWATFRREPLRSTEQSPTRSPCCGPKYIAREFKTLYRWKWWCGSKLTTILEFSGKNRNENLARYAPDDGWDGTKSTARRRWPFCSCAPLDAKVTAGTGPSWPWDLFRYPESVDFCRWIPAMSGLFWCPRHFFFLSVAPGDENSDPTDPLGFFFNFLKKHFWLSTPAGR